MRLAHVLTYHSGNIAGNDYATNNLVAFREDLRIIRHLGLSIIPLRTLVDALIEGRSNRLPEQVVAITFDDGLDFDFVELVHPKHGMQPSVAGIMREFASEFQVRVHATSFVIASPEARAQIADNEMLGYQWISDSWWRQAVASGLFHIANHTWDHVSPSVRHSVAEGKRRSSSQFIDNPAAAELQVRRAREYIERIAPNPGSALLAFPYGDYSEFLVADYLPDVRLGHGTVAAFTGKPGVVTPESNRWTLPRNSCGRDWTSPEGLTALLGA
jgi:peptidoglycan/xylan/chitin deacetylase (PgdA/CDA1 family)